MLVPGKCIASQEHRAGPGVLPTEVCTVSPAEADASPGLFMNFWRGSLAERPMNMPERPLTACTSTSTTRIRILLIHQQSSPS